MLLPQKDVRVEKFMPIFHDWSFDATLEYDDAVLDRDALRRVVTHAARYGGFGDFRPTFGRADVEFAE